MKEAVSALRERTGARPVLLPPPYARGHFTVRCAAAPQNDALFTFRRGEGCAFASMTDGYLAALLRKMDASVPRFLPDPARSPEDTLLERILSHGFAEGGADCPQLIRLCLDLDEDRRCAVKNGRVVELTSKEYDILQYFFLHRGKVLDVRSVYEGAWGEKYMPTSTNTVMVHILNLRKKLEEDPTNPKLGKGVSIWLKVSPTAG